MFEVFVVTVAVIVVVVTVVAVTVSMLMTMVMVMVVVMVMMMVMVVTFNGQLKSGGLSLAKAATDQDHLGPCPDHHHVVDPEYLSHVLVL